MLSEDVKRRRHCRATLRELVDQRQHPRVIGAELVEVIQDAVVECRRELRPELLPSSRPHRGDDWRGERLDPERVRMFDMPNANVERAPNRHDAEVDVRRRESLAIEVLIISYAGIFASP